MFISIVHREIFTECKKDLQNLFHGNVYYLHLSWSVSKDYVLSLKYHITERNHHCRYKILCLSSIATAKYLFRGFSKNKIPVSLTFPVNEQSYILFLHQSRLMNENLVSFRIFVNMFYISNNVVTILVIWVKLLALELFVNLRVLWNVINLLYFLLFISFRQYHHESNHSFWC